MGSNRTDAGFKVADRADTALSLISRLWEAKGYVGLAGFTGAAILTAMNKVFEAIGSYGLAGWFLAALPATIIALGFWSSVGWFLHLRKMRSIREASNPEIDAGSPALSVAQVNGMISQALSVQIATIKDDVTALREQSTSLMTEFQQVNEIVSDLFAKDRAEYVRGQIEKIDSDTAKLDALLQAMISKGSNPASFEKTIDYKPPMRYLKENLESVTREIFFMDGTALPDVPIKPYNPGKAIPGDDAIVNDEFLYDYRAEHHNVTHLKGQLRVLREQKENEMRDLLSTHRDRVENYGK